MDRSVEKDNATKVDYSWCKLPRIFMSMDSILELLDHILARDGRIQAKTLRQQAKPYKF